MSWKSARLRAVVNHGWFNSNEYWFRLRQIESLNRLGFGEQL